MSIISRFAGRYAALDYAYGIVPAGGPSLQIGTGNPATGAGTITVITGVTETQGGDQQIPIAITTPITVGIGANAETVTPTAVSAASLAGFGPGPLAVTVTATFANLHGPQEPVTSGTYGLQEAINAASANGGGIVVVSAGWYAAGGTAAIVAAATLPTAGNVTVEDTSKGGLTGNTLVFNSPTVVAAPATATSAMVASQAGVTGTWAASTTHVQFTYVTANGGESLPSADYSFTATLNTAIGGPGPAASTGAVGYRVYIGTTAWLAPVTAANGTVIQCGPIAAFKIGTPFSIAALTVTGLALVPTVSTAFPAGVQSVAGTATVYPPFAVTGIVTAGTAKEWGRHTLAAGFLNQVGRTIRLKLSGYYTPVSTATLILAVNLVSVAGVTSTVIFTVTTPASSGTTAANINAEITIVTATTGAAGTVECHGWVLYGGATATAGLLVAAGDSVQAVSSACDLTKQDFLQVTINSGAANITQSQLRIMTVEVLQ
jgi:hypothetical protein